MNVDPSIVEHQPGILFNDEFRMSSDVQVPLYFKRRICCKREDSMSTSRAISNEHGSFSRNHQVVVTRGVACLEMWPSTWAIRCSCANLYVPDCSRVMIRQKLIKGLFPTDLNGVDQST